MDRSANKTTVDLDWKSSDRDTNPRCCVYAVKRITGNIWNMGCWEEMVRQGNPGNGKSAFKVVGKRKWKESSEGEFEMNNLGMESIWIKISHSFLFFNVTVPSILPPLQMSASSFHFLFSNRTQFLTASLNVTDNFFSPSYKPFPSLSALHQNVQSDHPFNFSGKSFFYIHSISFQIFFFCSK